MPANAAKLHLCFLLSDIVLIIVVNVIVIGRAEASCILASRQTLLWLEAMAPLLSARVTAAHHEEGNDASKNEKECDPGHEHEVNLHEASTVDLVAIGSLSGLNRLAPLGIRSAVHALKFITRGHDSSLREAPNSATCNPDKSVDPVETEGDRAKNHTSLLLNAIEYVANDAKDNASYLGPEAPKEPNHVDFVHL